jgi:hypothetical protein
MNFYEFNIPAQINGTQLKEELGCTEVYICDGKLIIAGELTEAQAAAGLAAHIPLPVLEPTVAQKLSSVGLSLEELRSALGGN